MKKYNKPMMIEEIVEIEDICSASLLDTNNTIQGWTPDNTEVYGQDFWNN